MKNDPASDYWLAFFDGEKAALAAKRCPKCGGALMWSPYIHDKSRVIQGKTEYPMGLSIYCVGQCNYMLFHLDGLAPDWTLKITNWDEFNRSLQSDNVSS